MIERFNDSLKRSAARAKEFMSTPEAEKPALFVDFINGLKVAAGSSHQLALTQENPYFLTVRDTIEKIIDIGQELPTFIGQQAGLWFSIKLSLEGIADTGFKMATRKALTRQQVLTQLDFRQAQIKVD